ncbi:MAG: terminase [Hyphomicrobiales bacterium]|nr:MAG: terminase [Hyphomicrobiales bacterium]
MEALDLSCPNWFDLLKAGRPPLPPDLPIDEVEARLAVEVFDRLRLPDVPGKPTFGEVGGDWARSFVRVVFGTVVMSDDRSVIIDRTVRKFFQLVPKKNSKTTNGAAIMVTALLRNRRPNAEFLLIGPTQAVAELAYDQASGIIEADPWLSKKFQCRDHVKTIKDRANGAELKIRSFDNKVLVGSKPVGVLIDEEHELGKISYARKVMTQIDGGVLPNEEGFVIIITTQSDSPPAGVFADDLRLARQIRDGKVLGTDTLPMLYEFPMDFQSAKERPWEDPENWRMVLPNLDRSIALPRLVTKFREAQATGVEALSIWASQHLNIQIGVALTTDGWAGAPYWPDAADPEGLSIETLIERCEVITAGIDGGGLDDLLGLSLIGRDKVTKDWLCWQYAWAHPDVLERRKEIAGRLQDLADTGQMTICDYSTQDIEELGEMIETVYQAGLFPEDAAIGLDPVGVAVIVDEMSGRGIPDDLMVAVPQGYRLSGNIQGAERKLKSGTLWHDGSDLMTWCVGNARAERRGSAILITKQVSGSAKIDPLIALFNAFSLMSRNPVASGPTVYQGRGALIL